MRTVAAYLLQAGDVLVLPFNRTATIQAAPKVGRTYVTFRTEHGKRRVGKYDEVLIESE